LKATDRLVVNSLIIIKIDENQHANHKQAHLEALEAPEEWQCCTKNFTIQWVWYIKMWMHVIFGYETKWEIVKSYTLRFAAAY
jgi:hypothetical protein